MPSNKVLVIGAGIAGVFAAYYLNKAGMDVTVVDKESGADNCSYGNAGMIVPSHIIPLASPGTIKKGLRWMLKSESPFYIRPRLNTELIKWVWKFKNSSTQEHVSESSPVLRDMLLQSRELLIRLEKDEDIHFDFQKKGLFMFCNTQKGLDSEAEVAESAKRLGIPAEILTPEQVEKREKNLDFNILGATYYPKDAHLHPEAIMDELKRLSKSRGVGFIYNTEISRFNSESGSIKSAVSSDGLTWKADYFIICCGAWSARLAHSIGINMPLQAGKGYSITLKNPPQMPENCGIFSEAKVTMTPMNHTLRFGGTMEIVGLDRNINRKKLAGLKKSVCRFLPEFKMTDLDTDTVWTGLRPCSPDGMPYVGGVKKYNNMFVSTGHAMMGMSLAPASGTMIRDLIINGHSDRTHPKIEPDRFH
jgi:D-amino-acid dehydrogenase